MATSDLAGRRLVDRYVLEERISSGGMATVWRARDEVLGRDVALKILHDQLAEDEEILERFRLEAVASARLGDPAVVRVFDTGVDEGVCFIVMELFRGETAATLLERRGPLPAEEAIGIARGALRGLGHAHASGIVHRDVKPSNVLIGEDGAVKVTDFGIAKAAFADGDLTTTGNLLGTAKYLAPEQVQGSGVDARSDLYAVGVVLFELLTGRPPFEAETHIATATMRLTNDPPPLRSVRPDISPELEAVVMRALARDPAERFQDAEEFAAALDRAARDGAPRTRPPKPSRREARAARPPSTFRSWVYVPLILVLMAALGVAGYLLVQELGRDGNGRRNRGTPERVRPLTIETAFDHDPEGDNAAESPEDVPLAYDDDPATAWETETYQGDDFGGTFKSGVGLVLDLGSEEEVGSVRIQTDIPGWTFEVIAADEIGEPLPDAEGESSFTADDETTMVELEPVTTRYVLVWITDLVEDAGEWRAGISEVDVFPPRG